MRSFGEKQNGTISCPFLRPPPKRGAHFCLPFFCFLFLHVFCFFAFSKREFKENQIWGVFEHPSKASSNIMQLQSPKPSYPPPPKKKESAPPIFRKLLFLTKNNFSKTHIFHHPLKIVHSKNSKNTIKQGVSKRWPGYWLKGGQDPKMAKMWPGYWPYSRYV